MIKMPLCCGKKMVKFIETPSFIEVRCNSCGDSVYIKTGEIRKPDMIDD